MANKDIDRLLPAEKLHDIIRNTLTPPIQTLMKRLEKVDTIEDAINCLEKMEHRINGMKCGLDFARERENGNK